MRTTRRNANKGSPTPTCYVLKRLCYVFICHDHDYQSDDDKDDGHYDDC